VLDEAGKIIYYLGVHRDITEMRHLQHQVASQKALIETVIDLAPVAFALLDEQDRVVLDNHEYKKLHSLFDGEEPARAVLNALLGTPAGAEREPGREFADREFAVERGGSTQRWFSCSACGSTGATPVPTRSSMPAGAVTCCW
jgi:protein-histidine pros-kinase